MHFSKTYSQLLLELPPELRENAIQYRQLKKLINRVVGELDAQGLHHDILEELSRQQHSPDAEATELHTTPFIFYEFDSDTGHIAPRVRLRLSNIPLAQKSPHLVTEDDSLADDDLNSTNHSLIWSLQNNSIPSIPVDQAPSIDISAGMGISEEEVIIPLASNSEFFNLLSATLHSLSRHSEAVRTDFVANLSELARTIGTAAKPVSNSSNSFKAYSITEHPGTIRIPTSASKSDLYFWREIFQLYVESEVFESFSGTHNGPLTLEESETRLQSFANRVTVRGLSDKTKLKSANSRKALESFLQVNLFVLNVKKFQFANTEAARKILKKHAKRTALPLPDYPSLPPSTEQSELALALAPHGAFADLPRLLVQAVTEVLLPVVPHLDDYSCLICTGLAYKPVRLSCGHLFCVRCLVVMQKRSQGHCPLCRAENVLTADRSNVDWGLLNFLQDWFPEEAKEKIKSNAVEAERDMYNELGLNPDSKCTVM